MLIHLLHSRLLLLLLSYIGGNWGYLKYLALVSFALGIPFIAIKASHSLRRLKCDTNILVRYCFDGVVCLDSSIADT